MNKKGDFDFEWLPGFREMMACQNEEQNTQQETDWGNENLQKYIWEWLAPFHIF